MRYLIAATLALLGTGPAWAQTVPDLSLAVPIAGNWTYAAAGDGSEAVFNDSANRPQLWLRCTRSTRRVTIAKAASVAAPYIAVWTSSQTRSVPASFNPATARLTIDVGAYDALLDALSHSRGRIGFIAAPAPALVLPPWPEPVRVIEDCRV